jgi:hypothetical protein
VLDRRSDASSKKILPGKKPKSRPMTNSKKPQNTSMWITTLREMELTKCISIPRARKRDFVWMMRILWVLSLRNTKV